MAFLQVLMPLVLLLMLLLLLQLGAVSGEALREGMLERDL
jgi:hypothetical protein